MTTPIESPRRASSPTVPGLRTRDRRRVTSGLVIAGVFVAVLIGVATSAEWAGMLASLAGFATAITVIAAVAISWEHVVVDARSEGLVESEVESR